ncbi:MAG: hypothetical protein ACJ75H_09310 [Thermoanaerobaculia bacterium]
MARPSPAGKAVRTGLALAAFLACACRHASPSGGEHPRALFFGSREDAAPLATASADTRLHVLFTPDFEHCTPEEMRIVRALRRIAAENPDTQVLTLLPASRGKTTEVFGERLPGTLVAIPDRAFGRQGRRAPAPRIEVWSREGRLLLMRSLPRVVTEEEVYEEVLWARSFTAPARL